jgi:hypothetical protein
VALYHASDSNPLKSMWSDMAQHSFARPRLVRVGVYDFWLTDVRKKKMTIYIGIQPDKLAKVRLIVNLFLAN